MFIDLRDRGGSTQIVFEPGIDAAAHEIADALRTEWCIGVVGQVRSRGSNANEKKVEVFSKAETPPFEIVDDVGTNEALRLKYRYLDLRRPELQKKLITRSQITRVVRQ